MFITWDDDKTTTSKGATTRRGIVATRSAANDATYHVTATARAGASSAKVGVKLGNRRLVTDHVVAADKVNGSVLALVRNLEAADRADEGGFGVIEHETAEDGTAEVHDAHGETVATVDVEEAGDAVGVILPADDE